MLSGKSIPPPVVINLRIHLNSFFVAYASGEEQTALVQRQISSPHLLVPILPATLFFAINF
jgi:hypothetical protein